MSQALTVEQFNRVLPRKMRNIVDQKFIDEVNAAITDPIIAESIRDNLLGFASVLEEGRFKLDDYVNAVRYVSFKIMGDSNVVAYAKTFPNRYQTLTNKGTSDKDISAYVAAFNKNKLVTLILKQTITPTHILNADIYQEAVNVQAVLMRTARSEKVRSDAAACLIKELRPPEATQIELNVKHTEDSALGDLRETTRQLVEQQRKIIEGGGMSAKEVAHSKIVSEAEVIDVDAERVE
ncbi:MAG: hypothetical protein JSV74_01280 [Dehalococcoidia bacterium]|nr:MAG: hypothetical protein JSV74_01280 [Dehalococcoidia bacterium]